MRTLPRLPVSSLIAAIILATGAAPAQAQDAETPMAAGPSVAQDEVQVPQPVHIKRPFVSDALVEKGMDKAQLTLLLEIGEDGRVNDSLALASTSPAFTKAVQEVVPEWRFSPATLNGEPVVTTMRIGLNYTAGRNVGSLNQTENRIPFFKAMILNPERDLVADADDVGTPPEATKTVDPQGFKDENDRVMTGEVLLSFYIDQEGKVRMPMLVQLDGDRALAESASAALRQWQFRPAKVRGKPVIVRARQRFIFREQGVTSNSEVQ